MFFIESPTASAGHSEWSRRSEEEKKLKPTTSSLRDTHPSIDERIAALMHY
jgi:Zn-dependent protease with chaperone function